MAFTDDLLQFEKLGDADFDSLVILLNENPARSTDSIAKYREWCSMHGLSYDMLNTFRNVLAFIARQIVDDVSIEAGCERFEKEYLLRFDNLERSLLIWPRIRSRLMIMEPFILARKKGMLEGILPEINEFRLICEKRPVFNLERSEIRSYLYPIIMEITTYNDARVSKSHFELSEEDLETIAKEFERAKKKLAILKSRD